MHCQRCLAFVLASWLAACPSHGQTQRELNEEAAEAAKKTDAEMVKAYIELAATIDETAVGRLQAAQQRWTKFRESEIEFAADAYRDGSIRPLIYWRAHQRLTEARAAELRDHLKQRREH